MWENLRKTSLMDAGTVGFYNYNKVLMTRVEKRINATVNRLKKTKVVDDEIDYQAEREARDAREREKRNVQCEIVQEEVKKDNWCSIM